MTAQSGAGTAAHVEAGTAVAGGLGATRRTNALRLLVAPGLVLLAGAALFGWVRSLELDSIERRTINTDYLLDRVWEHLLLSFAAAALVAVLAIPVGILVHRASSRVLRAVVLGLANVGQATPAVGVVILLAIVWQTGFTTALVALVAYSFLPVLRNTLTGLAEVDAPTCEAARGMGMTRWQVLRKIELPLASPVILAGLRTSLVFAVGVATIATFINAGGLGDMIVNGLKLQRYPVLIVGSALVAAIAILIDWLAGLVEEYARPRGL
ncbi:ABC transporter permease [Nocardioides sp. SYSU DS0663]|uniref:ABC transporter permease n=1 Tax=Nocardioides sp. SYSU DS0663 TaxID=3416445 RepID=UPI003F4C9584